ncbi:PREDICTED: fatty acid synthase-like [Ceratosolen solmsi marchali]|uniref:Fatty acid synthase-like n=1 Tax=Ceratosolen solmsi marchali TaxID=326594 RepID=A0AAJ6YRX7_9HYME|nr:PREDICTED: fatty acid synthase-like [Ceratosolen solmsi marchali]
MFPGEMIHEEIRPRKLPEVRPGDEVVISGVAGRFPSSDNMDELRENLMSKVDLIAPNGRWKLENPDIPLRVGQLSSIEKFDALFFGVHFKQAHTMDPQCRMLLEHTYEAIIDAGINPRQLRGSRTGVFIGASFSESEKTWFYDKINNNGFGITGCARAMFSNRISYWLGVTGPSYTVDTACSSSLYALEHAYRAIREGLCDSAIVGGSNICLHPFVAMQFYNLGVTSLDGRCKSFDDAADGYARSEAICVVFLQKAKEAKRIYATLVHGKLNCDGFKEQGITFPSTRMQSLLFKECYMECGIPPTMINYIEAHGTGTRVGDAEEVNAIDNVFTPGRKTPLLIGSGKSNFGHTESASGVCSVAKVIIAMETGTIPPNLHYNVPKQGIPALKDGRMKVVTEATTLEGEYIGVNSFGFGGANVHMILKSNPKVKVNNGAPMDNLPRLVAISGRTEEAVSTIINKFNSRPIDVEYIRLFHDIHAENIKGNLYRGYTILPSHGVAKHPIKDIQFYPETKRPVWFIFAGMGSQWPGMGEALLNVPIFAKSITICDVALKPLGVDIYRVLTSKDKDIFDNIVNAFVGIAAIQIGLIDVLRSVGIEPDYVMGHSVGELACGYADGCFTAEQMILCAYSRGLASQQMKCIRGAMAAVGIGYNELKNICPPDIDIACHNAADSATISGPIESIERFVAHLQSKKIFAKEVACSNIPYHSRYIASSRGNLYSFMKEIIPHPKTRSSRWLSTSVPIDQQDTPEAKLSSAEYHTNNVLGSVYFEETSALIPKNAIAIEIAPHGLLQAILRRSLDPNVINISLTQRGHSNNIEVLLQGLGKMFVAGLHPKLANLYPPVEFPVSRATPMISPLIKWEHSDNWFVTSYESQRKAASSQRIVKVSLSDSEFEHMAGHIIDKKNLFPATGYVQLVWETFTMMHDEQPEAVVFEDVRFLRATNIPQGGFIEFVITVQRGTGRFEIVEGGAAVVDGVVRTSSNPAVERSYVQNVENGVEGDEEVLNSEDVYKELKLRGYYYAGLYQSIKSATYDGSKGHIWWRNDWPSFMDNMLQMQILHKDSRNLLIPTRIKKILIDTKAHFGQIKVRGEDTELPVRVDALFDAISCGGVEIRGLKASAIARRKPVNIPIIEEYKFVPHLDGAVATLLEIITLVMHITMENHLSIKVKTIELVEESDAVTVEGLLSPLIVKCLKDFPLIQDDITIINATNTLELNDLSPSLSVTNSKSISSGANALVTIGSQLLIKSRKDNLKLLLQSLKIGGFLLTREVDVLRNNIKIAADDEQLDIILEKKHGNEMFILLRKRVKQVAKNISVVHVTNDDFKWIEDMRKIMTDELKRENNLSARILFVGRDVENGLMGFINSLRKEAGGEMVRGLLIQDPNAPKFSLSHPLYAKQIQKDLAVSVLRDTDVWGTYRYLPIAALEPHPVQHCLINQCIRGDLSSLTWFQGPIPMGYQHKDLVSIAYCSVNFKDVMMATGKLVEDISSARQAEETFIGFEYSGTDASGKRVMGLLKNSGFSNICIADRDLAWEIPANWSLEDAATVPCVYGTSYYALYMRGRMKKGDKVLIHAGTGGVGQAAINLALHEGCEIFTTVGTPDKRNFIRKNFPQIPDDHIGNSRDISFEQMIIQQTKGRGVDIVLNSLAEEKLQASVNCLAWGGRFLEIGKFDLTSNNPLGMEVFLREISFSGIMLDHLISEPRAKKIELYDLMYKGLESGAVKPLIRTVFEKDQVEAAFRYMAAGKHIGKVIVKMRNEDQSLDRSMGALTTAIPRYYCHKDCSYIVLGGLGGFGLELVDWLILRGAKNLVLTSRSGVKSGYQKMRMNLWEKYGIKVIIMKGMNAGKVEDCQSMIKRAMELGPVDGVFNLAAVVKDATWENQTAKLFEETFISKAWATRHFDTLTRQMCPRLRHFVVFSSVACGRGNAGQTNYAMANSVMERICEKRVEEGLPALAVQWGIVDDVGIAAAMNEKSNLFEFTGMGQQRITSCLEELDKFLHQKRPVVSSIVVDEKRSESSGSTNMVDTVLSIMGRANLSGVSHETSLVELGMDSMMAVEIKQTLEREFDVFLTAQEIRKLNFAKIEELMGKSDGEGAKTSLKESKKIEVLTGMKLFLQRVIGYEDINRETCVRLPTKQEIDKPEIFLVPGIEGLSTVFTGLARNIKAPATCLQTCETSSQRSIFDTADQLLPHVLERSEKGKHLTIIGYSFGAIIAIELARRLEERDLQCQLILIDGAPDHMKNVLSQQFIFKNDDEFQNNVLIGIMNVIYPVNISEMNVNLKKSKNWEEKLQVFTAHVHNDDISENDQKDICTSIYNRLVAARNYDISRLSRIKAPMILLKPSTPSLVTTENYGLSKVTSGKIDVYYVDGNHVTMLDDERVAAVINGEKIDETISS